MTTGLDTSIVVRLLIGVPAEQADAARRALERQPRETIGVSDLVVGESYFALRHHYGVPHGRAVAAIAALLSDSRVRCTGVAARVLGEPADKESGPGLMDRLIHADYQRNDLTLLTFDRAAARLDGARLLAR